MSDLDRMDMYNVTKKLGQGSFGTVFLCEKKHNRQKIVIKQIPINLLEDNLKVAQNEVNILRSLSHPNIIECFDSYVKLHSFYIVMEYASHGNLHDYLMRNKENKSYLSAQSVMDFFCQLVLGLHHIHEKGILHRDLKTENIFTTGRNMDVLKIGDFGISKPLKNNYVANTVIGTCHYLAPEICEGKSYDKKCDIWSLGCVLYEMCQMEKLFPGTVCNVLVAIASGKLKTINTKLYGKQMQELLNLLLKPDPVQRPDTKTIMSLGDVFPSLYCLNVNLGCIF